MRVQVQVFAFYYFWSTVYAGRRQLEGYSWSDMQTYIFVAFVANMLLSFYTETGISQKIRDGSIAMDLARPSAISSSFASHISSAWPVFGHITL